MPTIEGGTMAEAACSSSLEFKRVSVNRTKYKDFQNQLMCEWTLPNGSLCGFQFNDIQTYSSHVKSHVVESSGARTCSWSGCDFPNTSVATFTQHVLFHPFHSYLKVLGSELQAKSNLPFCQMDEGFKNLVPPQCDELICHWDDGKCNVVFESVVEFYSHVRSHVASMGIQSCQCKWKGCTFEGRDRSKVQEHLRSHTNEKVVACPNCGSLFASNSKFKDHLTRQQSTEQSSFSCSICFRTYPSERLLREHVRRHINTLKCPHCDLTCNSPSRLQHHIHFRHNEDKPHQCPVCQKGFKTSHCLSEHLESHGQKTFVCSVGGCKYAAKTLKSWQNHIKKAHMPEQKQYCCHVCGQCFSEGLQLSTHLKAVHGFSLPPGHSRFRYITGSDGFKRLQTVRLDDDHIVTPN